MKILIYSMVYLGSALMVLNIYRYYNYAKSLHFKNVSKMDRFEIYIPLILLVCFLFGYLAVGIMGHPDLIVSGILFGGSIFVFIIFLLLQRVTNRIYESERIEAELMAVEESNRVKTSFLASMSHEMRTPMNAIIGLDVIALRNPAISSETRACLEKIGINARHLLSLIENILDMGQFDTGTAKLHEKPFSLRYALEPVNMMIQSQCDIKGLEYKSTILSDLEGFYNGDELKLKQMLLSILENAVKFTEKPGSVVFTTEQTRVVGEDCELRFTIKDTGIGVSKNFIPQMFDAFTQEDPSSTNRYGGSGLGLAIAKNIALMMRGNIEVESEKDRGSVFTVTILLQRASAATIQAGSTAAGRSSSDSKGSEANGPAAGGNAPESADIEAGGQSTAASSKAQEDASAKAGSAAGGSSLLNDLEFPELSGRRILIVEDVDINAEILADLLEMEDVLSERAENGQVALDLFSEKPVGYYDAILMDLRMPVMDGLEASRRIRALDREDAKQIPIIAVTANAFEEDKLNALEAGMNIHLSKPVDSDLLCHFLEREIAHLSAGAEQKP